MENKRYSKKIQRNNKNDLSCIKKIIKYQEKIYNMNYRAGKWIRRYHVKSKDEGSA
jgi:hypothetical protein